jgi:hypothetical protein
VVSQFGYEYGRTGDTARELARVLAPRARLSFLVHHAGSSIVAANRARLGVLDTLLGPTMSAAFCSGDAASFNAQMSALLGEAPQDPLIGELARSLPARLSRTQRERLAIWKAIEDALEPERCLGESLNACCVAEQRLDEWLDPLRGICDLLPPTVLREPGGEPIAWQIEGTALAE